MTETHTTRRATRLTLARFGVSTVDPVPNRDTGKDRCPCKVCVRREVIDRCPPSCAAGLYLPAAVNGALTMRL